MKKRNIINSNKDKDWCSSVLILALLVGILPPIWAVLSPYMGIHVGPIALIAAGIYGANGNKFEDALKISIGYLMGDIWSLVVILVMKNTIFNRDLTLFVILFFLGFFVVIISFAVPKYFYMPSWLAGWAIAMLTMNLNPDTNLGKQVIEIGISMLVGVYYVGVLIDKIFKFANSVKDINK